MSQNRSKQSLSKSQLARHYQIANNVVFGIFPFIRSEYLSKFIVMEDDLREDGISCKDYAYTVVRLLEKWTRNKGMNHVPINVFLGNMAHDKFMKVYKSETVTVPDNDSDEEKMLHSELLVARMYIELNTENGNVVRLKDVVKDIEQLLYEDWLLAYENGRGRPVSEALDILCLEYRVMNARNYSDIVTEINNAR